MRNSLIPCALALVLAACGGGGGGDKTPAPSSISGTAAVGAPLSNATVEVKCRQGTGTGITDASGRLEVSVAAAQAPCLLKVNGQGVDLVSVSPVSGGTASITSLTHLLAAQLLRIGAPAGAFSAAGESTFASITEQGLSAAQGTVTQELVRIGAQMPSVNWITQPFTAAPGDAMDGALELLKTRLAAQNKTLAGAAIELATGPLQVVVPPGGGATCIPGMIAGFDGPLQDALTRVISQPTNTGDGDGPGGIGGADGGADGAAGGVGVGGSLGQFTNVDVSVRFASGATFGPIRADAAKGMITLVACDGNRPDSAVLTDNQNGVYGAVLGGLAKAAARSQPGSNSPALAIQKQFADDLADGVLDLRQSGTPARTLRSKGPRWTILLSIPRMFR